MKNNTSIWLKIYQLTFFIILISPAYIFGAEGEESLTLYAEKMILYFFLFMIVLMIVFFAFHQKDIILPVTGLKLYIKKINDKLTDATPVEKEKDILLDHEYDGIKELDNNLPPWWKYLFYVTIIFSFIYMLHYHVLGTGKLSDEEYKAEVEYAELQLAMFTGVSTVIDETTVKLLTEPAALFSGKEIYGKNCAACHGQRGEGLVGPNLTDEYWIHGGSISDIFVVVRDGIPEKGMLPWRGLLSPSQMQDVSSYVISMYGTDPPNAKAPEGEKFIQEDDGI